MKKIIIVAMCSLFLLTGCREISQQLNKDNYFVSKTGKIKNPYTLSKDDEREINARGQRGNGGQTKDFYTMDGVSGLYIKQFIKPGKLEFDMNLVQSEMEIQSGKESPKIEKMYLCEKTSVSDEVKVMNETVKNRFSELENAVNQEVSEITNRENMKAQIVTVKTVSYAKNGKNNCDSNIHLLVKIPAQQDFPEIFMGLTFDYFDTTSSTKASYDNPSKKTFYATSGNHSLHKNGLYHCLIGYFQYDSKREKFEQLRKEIQGAFGNDYIFMYTEDGISAGSSRALPNYENSGIELITQPTTDAVRNFVDNKILPPKEVMSADTNEKNPEKIYIKLRPTKESEIVSFEKLAELQQKIKEVGKRIFGYEVKINLDAKAGFRSLNYGVSEKILGTAEVYQITLEDSKSN